MAALEPTLTRSAASLWPYVKRLAHHSLHAAAAVALLAMMIWLIAGFIRDSKASDADSSEGVYEGKAFYIP